MVGRDVAQQLITEGMRMAPPEPSFLDMRNAILAAEAGLGGANRNAIWQVFARRGMGYRAHTDGARDVTPSAGLQPAAGARRPARGHDGHRDFARERPALANVTVGLESLVGEAGFPDELATRTAANGTYALDAPAGTYGELAVEHPGYSRVAVPGFAVRAEPVSRTSRCVATGRRARGERSCRPARQQRGPVRLRARAAERPAARERLVGDQGQRDGGRRRPLPEAIDVTGFGLDPANTCGNDIGASTGGYRVETSSDGVNFTTAAQGTFGPADRGRLNVVPPSARNVR